MIHPNVIQKVLFSVLVLNPWNFGWLNFKHLYNHPKPTWRENCHFELISFLAWKKGVTTWCQADHSPWIVASNKLMLLMNTIMHHLECTSPIILCIYIYKRKKTSYLPNTNCFHLDYPSTIKVQSNIPRCLLMHWKSFLWDPSPR